MEEIVVQLLRNATFRLLIILLPAIVALLIHRKLKIDRYIFLLVLSAVASELFTLYHEGYNLVEYGLFIILDVVIISILVSQEIRNGKYSLAAILLTLIFFVFFMVTDYSSMDLLKIENNFPVRKPFDTHQFFDFCSLCNLVIITLTFIWMYNIVKSQSVPDGGNTKRFIYIFGLLGYYCGGFFTLAFGRYIVGDISIWFEYWNKIFLPLYLLFYLTLNIGLLWKPAPSS